MWWWIGLGVCVAAQPSMRTTPECDVYFVNLYYFHTQIKQWNEIYSVFTYYKWLSIYTHRFGTIHPLPLPPRSNDFRNEIWIFSPRDLSFRFATLTFALMKLIVSFMRPFMVLLSVLLLRTLIVQKKLSFALTFLLKEKDLISIECCWCFFYFFFLLFFVVSVFLFCKEDAIKSRYRTNYSFDLRLVGLDLAFDAILLEGIYLLCIILL